MVLLKESRNEFLLTFIVITLISSTDSQHESRPTNILKSPFYTVNMSTPVGDPFLHIGVTERHVTSCLDVKIEQPNACLILPNTSPFTTVRARPQNCPWLTFTATPQQKKSESSTQHRAGYFYSSNPLCPSNECVVFLSWENMNGTINQEEINIIVCPDEPLNCSSSLSVNEWGTDIICRVPQKEAACLAKNIVRQDNLSMELNGPDKDKFFLDKKTETSYVVYARGDSTLDETTAASISIWRAFPKWPRITTSVKIHYMKAEPAHRSVTIEANQPRFGPDPTILACTHEFGETIKKYQWNQTYHKNNGGIVYNVSNIQDQIYTLNPFSDYSKKTVNRVTYTCEFNVTGNPRGSDRILRVSDPITIKYFPESENTQTFSVEIDRMKDKFISKAMEESSDLWALKLYLDAMFRKFTRYNDDIKMPLSVDNIIRGFDGSTKLTISYPGEKLPNVSFAVTSYLDNVSWPGAFYDATEFLSGSLLTFNLEESFSRVDKINVPKKEMSISVTKDGTVSLSCLFVSCIEHQNSQSFEWKLNGVTIFTDDNKLLYKEKCMRKSPGLLCTTQVMQIALVHKKFTADDFGLYTCEMHLYSGNRTVPWTVKHKREISLPNAPELVTLFPPRLEIHPKAVYTTKPGARVNFYCSLYYYKFIPHHTEAGFFNHTGFFTPQEVVTNEPITEEGYNHMVRFTENITVIAPNSEQKTIHIMCFTEGDTAEAFIALIDENESFHFCQETTDEFGTIWLTTPCGNRATQPCPSGYSGDMFRVCNKDSVWDNPSYLGCSRNELNKLSKTCAMMSSGHFKTTTKSVDSISFQLKNAVNPSIPPLPSDLLQVIRMMHKISNAVSISNQAGDEGAKVTSASIENFASVTNDLLSTDTHIWEQLNREEMASKRDMRVTSGTKLLHSMDSLIKSSLNGDDNVATTPIVTGNLVIKRGTVKNKAEDIHFPKQKDLSFYEEQGGWALDTNSTAFLPFSAYKNHSGAVHYAIVLYKNLEGRFSTHGHKSKGHHGLEGSEIVSEVLSFSTNLKIETLSSELELHFQLNTSLYPTPVCAYLDTATVDGMAWTDKHCRTEKLGEMMVHCSCSHLTNFAVLMSPRWAIEQDTVHYQALSFLSLVGCIISIVCLSITLLTFAIVWRKIEGTRTRLHIFLSASLLVAYLLFVGGIDKTGNETGCMVITVLLHYFLLVAFSVMLTEGVELYTRVQVVFARTNFGWKLLVPSFVAPIIIVGITLGAAWDSGYRSPSVCWLNIESGALWSFLGPVIFVIAANTIIVILVFRAMLSTRAMSNQESRNKIKTVLKAIIVITPLLGFTWISGLMAVHKDAVIFHYIFAVFNSLQGLFIFLFHCLLSKQVREAVKLRARVFKSQHITHSTTGGTVSRRQHETAKSTSFSRQVELTRFTSRDDS